MIVKNLREVANKIDEELKKIRKASLEGVIEAARVIKKSAQNKCPEVTGNLKKSAFITYYDPSTGESGVEFEGQFVNHPNKNADLVKAREEEREFFTMQSVNELKFQRGSNIKAEIGFSASYALAVHENPNSGKTRGKSPSGTKYKPGTYAIKGEWKFLETAFKENEGRVLSIVASKAKRK